MAELYLQKPLFDGASEIDQLLKIIFALGTPPKTWTEGYKLASKMGFKFPDYSPQSLSHLIPNAS